MSTNHKTDDPRSHKNAMAQLRRELRETHPEIVEAMSKVTLPKHKRYFGHSIGAQLESKSSQSINTNAAIPGSTSAPPAEVEFEIIKPYAPIEIAAQTEQTETQDIPVYQPRRNPAKDRQPRPSTCKTLTPAQLEEANRLLHTEGKGAMDMYVNVCRTEMVATTPELVSERFVETAPVAPVVPVTTPPIKHSEEDEMSSMLERARLELGATNERINHYQTIITETTELLESETARLLQLEQYITQHELLVNEATSLLQILPPPVVPEPPTQPAPPAPLEVRAVHVLNPVKTSLNTTGVTIRDIREHVFPVLKAMGLREFSTDQLVAAMNEAGVTGPNRVKTQQWMHSEMKRLGSELTKGDRVGYYRFKQERERELRHA